jgi:hypothetical protein
LLILSSHLLKHWRGPAANSLPSDTHKKDPLIVQVIKNKLPRSILTELVKMERAEAAIAQRMAPPGDAVKFQWGEADLHRGLAEIASVREEVSAAAASSQEKIIEPEVIVGTKATRNLLKRPEFLLLLGTHPRQTQEQQIGENPGLNPI